MANPVPQIGMAAGSNALLGHNCIELFHAD